jgi:OOP family OmpA-OmpF porin
MNTVHPEKKMNTLPTLPQALFWALALSVSPGLSAQGTPPQTGVYMGLGAGESHARIDSERIRQSLLDQGLGTNSLTEDRRGNGYKAFLGFPIGFLPHVQ